MDDQQILVLFGARDEEAIRAVAEKYGNFCRGIAFGILGDRRDAEECFSDVLMSVWNAIPPACPENLPSYLAACTRRRALNLLERNKAQKRGGGVQTVPLSEVEGIVREETPETPALAEALNRFLGSLKQETRVIFMQYYYFDETAAEIAREHGCSTVRVKSLLLRTKRSLERALRKEGLL